VTLGYTDLSQDDAHWKARLDVEVRATPFGSRLGNRLHSGPLRIQRPFFPEGPGVLHLYLLHPPGGVVGGDQLEVQLKLAASAQALVTTPAAQKLYRSPIATSRIRNTLEIGPDACLEWLPMETIVFDGAQSSNHLRIRLDANGSYVGWDIVCFGRPASVAPFSEGKWGSSLEISRGDLPLLIERTQVQGGSPTLTASWGYANNLVAATFVCTTPDLDRIGQAADAIRELLRKVSDVHAAVTAMDGLVVLRLQARSIERVRRVLIESWSRTRPFIAGRQACLPRIWST
jgi:urease accessory protein